jgi:transcriptional regulator with XRE-family HTH domain
MTGWSDYKKNRPPCKEVQQGYDEARDAMGVGYLVLKARASAGLTQAQLAEQLVTSQSMVARWESGAQVPSVRTLMRIAKATGFELALGLHHLARAKGSFLVLEVLEAQGKGARGRVIQEAAS